MKYFCFILLVFISCKKDTKPGDIATITINVTESISGKPVEGASVVLYRCSVGCLTSTDRFRGLTDKSGICKVPSEHFNDPEIEMQVYNENYWPFATEKKQTISLLPLGWIGLRLKQRTTIPQGSVANVFVGRQGEGIAESTTFNLPDSIVIVRSFGGEKNEVIFQVVDATNQIVLQKTISNLSVPLFDTLQNVILDY